MEHQEVVTRLRNLREEIERDGEMRIAALETTFALALSDVCCALGLTGEDHAEVLGQAATAYVTEICQMRFWSAERNMEEKTATLTLPEIVAVPA